MFSATVGRCGVIYYGRTCGSQVNAEDCLPELILAFNEATCYIRNVVRGNAEIFHDLIASCRYTNRSMQTVLPSIPMYLAKYSILLQ